MNQLWGLLVLCTFLVSRTCYNGRTGFWWCQVTLVSVAYVLYLASLPLGISSATYTHCLWLELVCLVFLVVSELLRFQMSLWSIDPEILHVRVPRIQAASRILKSWHDQTPKNLCYYDHGCVRTPGSPASSGCWVVGFKASIRNLLRALAKTGRHHFLFIPQRGMSLIQALRTQNIGMSTSSRTTWDT